MRTLALILVFALAGGLVYLFVTAEEPAAVESPDKTPESGTETSGSGDMEDVRDLVNTGGASDSPSASDGVHTRVFTDSAQCAECHQDVYDEWLGSQHERAWKNPLVAQISDQFRNKICIDCHAPRPVLETGLGKRVLARQTGRDDGVNCFSCHDMGGGRMAASTQGLSGECAPTFDARLRTVDHCAVCHNQHGTVDEWRETDFARMDPVQDCVSCHMTPVERTRADGTKYQGFDHRMLAGHDIEVIRQAPELTAEIVDNRVEVSVTNRGAGHNFPTDERHRAVDLVVRILDADGNLIGQEHRDRYRNPYRDEAGQNTQIPWGETRSYTYELPPAGSGTVDVRLIYKLTPYVPDEEGKLIFEREVSWP